MIENDNKIQNVNIFQKTVLYVKQVAYTYNSANFQIDTIFYPKTKFLSTTLHLMVTSYNETLFLGVLAHVKKKKTGGTVGLMGKFCIRNLSLFSKIKISNVHLFDMAL